jgi:hypothetical protein
MPLQSWEEIIVADEGLRTAAEANSGDGVFQPTEIKVGCYCYNQNCFGILKELHPLLLLIYVCV